MSEVGVHRRLAAILVADVVGYSRLMGEDEAGTLAALKAHREQLIRPKVAAHEGRIVKLMGDGVLAEFPSALEAVRCAIEVQRAMAERNADVPEAQQVRFRIGVNLGDVISEGDDIYGDGINVAARLEELAKPGGICLSSMVHVQIHNKIDVRFHHLGEQELKNIAYPVHVFSVLLDGAEMPIPERVKLRHKITFGQLAGSAFVVLLLVVAGVTLWLKPWEPREEPASEANMAFPLPDKPSIAVLPFNNMSDDASQEYFTDGMTEDLITDLSKNPGLFVIARNSSFAYKGQKVKVHQLAEELGVRYVLEGSVRRVADELRINAQLIDATTGGHLWAERYDGTLADVFDLQDKVTERIVAALALKLTPHEAGSMRGPGTDNVAAHDAYLLGLSHYYRSTPTDNAKARDHFEQAVELDPNYSAAYTALAKVYLKVRGEAAYSEKLGIYWMAGYTRARRLLEKGMARPNADSHVLLSWFALRKRQHDRAIDEANRALELSPNSSDALEALAEALIYSGQPTEGIEVAERAMRQNPALPGRPLYLVGLAEFTLGVPQNAVEHLERALRHAPNQTHYADILAASYAELSNLQHAEAAFEILAQGLHYEERADLVRLVASHPISSLRVLDRLADGLRVAGARSGFGGYLPLSATNRLSGDDIRSLLFGRKIKGTQLTWQASEFDWRQQRTADGGVEHFGFPVQPGVFSGATGTGRIEDDMLCERWPELSDILDICVVIYRIPEGNAKILWGDYVMFTDLGPQPFRLVE